MKAVQLSRTGGPDVLDYVDLPDPVPGPGEVLVKAHAIGVAKPDGLFRTGVYRWMPSLPAIPGAEMSGRIEKLGPGVDGLQVGQKVLVYHLGGGCYAEKIAVTANDVTPLPDAIDLDDAVSIPNFQVAWALLNIAARGLDPKAIYINGAAGGIGSAVLNWCRLGGLTVIAGAASAEKCAFVESQGATHTIDYSRENVVERVQALTGGHGADLILDQVVGKDFTDNLKMLAPLGLIVSFNVLGGLPEKDLFREMRAFLPKSPAVRCFTMHSFDHDPAAKKRVVAHTLELFASGKAKPPIYAKIPLAEVRRAHELLDARRILGKLVLKP